MDTCHALYAADATALNKSTYDPSLLVHREQFKVIVFGEVDKELATALEAFAKFQVSIAKPAATDAEPKQ